MKELKMVTRRPKTILVVCALLFLVRVGHCSHHHHHHNNTTTDATGTKRADVMAVGVTFLASIASTYLQNFLTKERAAVVNVINLSNDYFVADECDTDVSTHVGTPPGNLDPKSGSTEIEVEIESKWRQGKNYVRHLNNEFVEKFNELSNQVKAMKPAVMQYYEEVKAKIQGLDFKKLKQKLKHPLRKKKDNKGKELALAEADVTKETPEERLANDPDETVFEKDEDEEKLKAKDPEYFKKNLGVRCSFTKLMPDKKKAKIIFFMNLRGSRNTGNRIPTSMTVVMCVEGGAATTPKCTPYDTYAKMKEPVKEWAVARSKNMVWENDAESEDPEIILGTDESLTEWFGKTDKYVGAGMFEKKSNREHQRKQEDTPLEPIYLCNKAVKNCVSVMMGNGGESVAEIVIHKEYPDTDFGVSDEPPPN